MTVVYHWARAAAWNTFIHSQIHWAVSSVTHLQYTEQRVLSHIYSTLSCKLLRTQTTSFSIPASCLPWFSSFCCGLLIVWVLCEATNLWFVDCVSVARGHQHMVCWSVIVWVLCEVTNLPCHSVPAAAAPHAGQCSEPSWGFSLQSQWRPLAARYLSHPGCVPKWLTVSCDRGRCVIQSSSSPLGWGLRSWGKCRLQQVKHHHILLPPQLLCSQQVTAIHDEHSVKKYQHVLSNTLYMMRILWRSTSMCWAIHYTWWAFCEEVPVCAEQYTIHDEHSVNKSRCVLSNTPYMSILYINDDVHWVLHMHIQ